MEPCEVKIYICVLFSPKFKSEKELDNHNRAEHVGERAFPCSACGNSFYYKQNMWHLAKGVQWGTMISRILLNPIIIEMAAGL